MRRASPLLVCLCLLALAPALAATSPPAGAPAVWVGRAEVAQELADVEPGLAQLLRWQLEGAGVPVVPGRIVRRVDLAQHRLQDLLVLAAQQGASRALFMDLVAAPAELEVRLRLYDVPARSLVAIASASTADGELGAAAGDALRALERRFALEDGALPPAPSEDLPALAALGRALRAFDRGDLASAWRAVLGRNSPALVQLRAELDSAAHDPAFAGAEAARLLAARGEMDSAWERIGADAESQLRAAKPDVRVLLAAGEVQLERGEVEAARRYLERAAQLDPDAADAYLGLGRAHALAGDGEAARIAFERAAKLAPENPAALELAAELDSTGREERARLLMQAGERAALQLDAERARRSLGRAVRLDGRMAAAAREKTGDVLSRIRAYRKAADAYANSISLGGATPARLRGLARAEQRAGDAHAAEKAWLQLLDAAADDAGAHRELGELYTETGRSDDAILHLERAVELRPRDAETKRSLARARHARGEDDAALALYERADALGGPTARSLAEAAAIDRAHGRLDAAKSKLERAAELEPALPALRGELAEVYREAGDEAGAARAEALLLSDAAPADAEGLGGEPLLDPDAERTTFELLVRSFEPAPAPVAVLGLREPLEGRALLLEWLRPRTVDLGALEKALTAAIAERYTLAESADGARPTDVDGLLAFAEQGALDSHRIARVNRALGTGAVFAANLERSTGGGGSACTSGPHLRIELRMLSGQLSSDSAAHSNDLCLAGGLARYGTWNWRAGAVYLVLLLLVAYPFVRGWGRVLVTFKFPPKTRNQFSVRLSQRRLRAVDIDDTGNAVRDRWKIEDALDRLSPFEKRLVGDRVEFGWVPARRRPYRVTVKGPMLDAATGELVGAFQEEKTVQVRRGRRASVEFDMRLKECAVEVNVYRNEQPVEQACVAVRGARGPLRYARGKGVTLYLGPGEHVIQIGCGDRVAERPLSITELAPTKLNVDMSDEAGLLFQDCPDAVLPYLEGRHLEAAAALESAGQTEIASRVRGEAHLERGERAAAAEAFEAAGDLRTAAELHAESDGGAASAKLFEEAGEYRRAAEGYRAQGDLASAARAYDQARDWDNAIACYRKLGDDEGLLDALEQAGEFFEAGEVAEGLGQTQRALENFQRLVQGDAGYDEACCRVAVLLAQEGETDLAIEKLMEARERMADLFSVGMLSGLATLLQQTGRDSEALAVWEDVRRRDLTNQSARERITALKRKLEATQAPPAAPAPAPAPAAESRYEILEEIGRGGMGVVYKARDKNLGRVVALKRLPDNLKDHPTAVKLFLREARSAAALNHPNIVTVHDAGQEDGHYFITMEYLEGTGLDGLVRAYGRLTPRDSALLGLQAANGLAYAHHNRIVHRDIKSSNLFYTNDRVVKIMDFGLAKAVEEVRKNASVIAGTPYFMAPEQIAGEVVDERSDLYSLGVTLYQLVTGTVPFPGGDATYHHRHTPAPDPREHAPELPAEFAELLLALLAKEPDQRIQTAAELATRLRAAAEQAPAA